MTVVSPEKRITVPRDEKYVDRTSEANAIVELGSPKKLPSVVEADLKREQGTKKVRRPVRACESWVGLFCDTGDF